MGKMISRTTDMMNQSKTRSLISFFCFLFVLLVLFCFYPYEFGSVYPFIFPTTTPTFQVTVLAIILVVIIIFTKIKKLPSTFYALFIIQFLGLAFSYIAHGNFTYVIAGLTVYATSLCILVFINSSCGLIEFYKRYNFWILIMALMGTIAFLLTIFKGLTPFYAMPDTAEEGRMIYNYFLTFSIHDPTNYTIMKYSGFFDEPGAMAQWGLFALLINKLFIKNKWIEIPLIVLLLFTFSLGFYIQIAVYFFLFYFNKKNFGKGIIAAVLVILVFLGLNATKDTDNDKVYKMSIGRIENMIKSDSSSKGSGGIGAVEDRGDIANIAWNEFISNPLFGTDREDLYIDDNLYEPLARYGLIGSIFIYFPFIWLLIDSLKRKYKNVTAVSVIMFLGFFHRPFHRTILWIVVFFSIIILYEQSKTRSMTR